MNHTYRVEVRKNGGHLVGLVGRTLPEAMKYASDELQETRTIAESVTVTKEMDGTRVFVASFQDGEWRSL